MIEGELPLMLAQPPLWLILIAFVCALGPLVFFHELGHYLVARLFGIAGRDLLDRLRARDRRLDRPAGHPLEGRLAAARRLRQVRRRHEPGEQSRGPRSMSRRSCATELSSSGRCGSASWSSLPGRPPISCSRSSSSPPSSPLVGDAANQHRRRDRARIRAAAAAGIQPGDRILSVAGRPTPDVRRHRASSYRSGPTRRSSSRSSAAGSIRDRPGHARGRRRSPIRFGQQVQARAARHLSDDRSRSSRVPLFQAVPRRSSYTVHDDPLDDRRPRPDHQRRRVAEELGGPIKIAQIAGQQAASALCRSSAARAVLN